MHLNCVNIYNIFIQTCDSSDHFYVFNWELTRYLLYVVHQQPANQSSQPKCEELTKSFSCTYYAITPYYGSTYTFLTVILPTHFPVPSLGEPLFIRKITAVYRDHDSVHNTVASEC